MITPELIATGVVAVFVTARELFEYRKRKKLGLKPNPERCEEHAVAINKINERIDDEILPDLKRIKEKLGIV